MARIADSTKEQIKQAASGRWPDILTRLAGIPLDSLDGQHHPCPKCGGDDRFRLVDASAGAVLCNQCFSKKNGDGFAAIQWSLGCKFTEAVEKVAEFLGIATSKKKKSDIDPAKDLDFRPWAPNLAAIFCGQKPGVTQAALLAAGAKMARYKRNYTVIALPVIGESLDTTAPVGWVLMNAMGGTLPRWNRQGEVEGQVKVKLTAGSKPGLVGVGAIEKLKTPGLVDRVWKCEGITDSIAVAALIPESSRAVAVTNANGAAEKPRWMASFLANYPTIVLHDADEPGQVGAQTWAREIAVQGGKVAIAKLPYEIAKDHGKDVRDWISEGHGRESLQLLVEAAEPIVAAKDSAGEVIADEQADTHFERKLCRDLQIEILGETDSGHVELFSMFHRKAVTILDIGKLSYDRLVQIVGPLAKSKVHKSNEDIEESYRFADVKEAIGLIAGYRRISDHDKVGSGVWPGRKLDGSETQSVVLVNSSSAARFNGDLKLREVLAPRVDGLLLDLAGDDPWFDFDRLAGHLTAVGESTDFALAAISECEEMLRGWRWKNPETDPTLVTGLIMATWIQTVWKWRPQISITGESNSGKTYLFQFLGGDGDQPGVFSKLAYKQAKSTEAGIRQGVGTTARVILCDEFEKSKDREKVLELIRTSSRGEKISRGTASQKALRFGLSHICWVAATETGLVKQPDWNRFISLELLKAGKGSEGKLTLPPGEKLKEIGQRLLAASIYHAMAARELAVVLKSTRADGIDPRVIESYSVPAAIMACAGGLNEDQARAVLNDFLKSLEKEEQGGSDHDDLLADILSSQVYTSPKDGVRSVGQVLESQSLFGEYAMLLEAKGVRLLADDLLFVSPRVVLQNLLKGTSWEGQKIDKVLLRIGGAERTTQRIGSAVLRGVSIPLNSEIGF